MTSLAVYLPQFTIIVDRDTTRVRDLVVKLSGDRILKGLQLREIGAVYTVRQDAQQGRWDQDPVAGHIRLGPGTTYVKGLEFESFENVNTLFDNEPVVVCVYMRHPRNESDEQHYRVETENTMTRIVIIKGTTDSGRRTLPCEILDVI